MRWAHMWERETRASLEVTTQRLRKAEESLRKKTLQVGEAARAERIRQSQHRAAAAAAAAAAAEAAPDRRASLAAWRASQAAWRCRDRTLAGVWGCVHAVAALVGLLGVLAAPASA